MMSEPLSPVFDFSAVTRFRTTPSSLAWATTQTSSSNKVATQQFLLDKLLASASKRASGQVVPMAGGVLPSPGSASFYRSFSAGDMRSGDAEGAREDEAVAAELLQPRPIVPKGWAGATSDPVEASADGEAYERDGVLVLEQDHTRSIGTPGSTALSGFFPVQLSEPAKAVDKRSLDNQDSLRLARVPASNGYMHPFAHLSAPVSSAHLGPPPGMSGGLGLRGRGIADNAVSPVKVVERTHAAHTSPRPDIESLTRSNLMPLPVRAPGSDGLYHASQLLGTPLPRLSQNSSSPTRGSAQRRQYATSNEQHAVAHVPRNSRYAGITSRYQQQPVNRASSVEPRHPSGRVPKHVTNRSSSLPKRVPSKPETASVHFKVPKSGAPSISLQDITSQDQLESAVQQALALAATAHVRVSATKRARTQSYSPAAPAINVNVNPAPQIDAAGSEPVSLEQLRQQLAKKHAQLRQTVKSLEDTELHIDAVVRRRQQVEDLMKLLVAQLHLVPSSKAAATTANIEPARPSTPPHPPPMWTSSAFGGRPDLNVSLQLEPGVAAALSKVTAILPAESSQHARNADTRRSTDAASTMFLPLPQPSSAEEAKPLHTRVQDLVNLRMQMMESTLSGALRTAPDRLSIPLDSNIDVSAGQSGSLSSASTKLGELMAAASKLREGKAPGKAVFDTENILPDFVLATNAVESVQQPTIASVAEVPSTDRPSVQMVQVHQGDAPINPDTTLARAVQPSHIFDGIVASTHVREDPGTSVVAACKDTPNSVRPGFITASAPIGDLVDISIRASSLIPNGTIGDNLKAASQESKMPTLPEECAAGDTAGFVAVPPRNEGPPAAMPLCVQCETAPALRRCHECGDDYCEACFTLVHKSGNRKHHLWTPFSPQPIRAAPARPVAAASVVSAAEVRRPVSTAAVDDVVRSQEVLTMKGSLGLFRKATEEVKHRASPEAAKETGIEPSNPRVLGFADGMFSVVTDPLGCPQSPLPVYAHHTRSPPSARIYTFEPSGAAPLSSVSFSDKQDPERAKRRHQAAADRFLERMHSANPLAAGLPAGVVSANRSRAGSPTKPAKSAAKHLSGGGGMASHWKLRI